MAKRPKAVHQMTIAQFEAAFPDEDACRRYLVARRWPNGVVCPRCGNYEVTQLKGVDCRWQCYNCAPQTSYRFSHIAGTVFENTNKPLRDWFRVTHMMLTSKKGMSALQIMRTMGFGSYKTAWYMCHRIRVALVEMDMDKLGGIVEVDETFIGGKDKNRHWRKRSGRTGGEGSGKTPIAGAVSRKGNVVARVIARVDVATLTGFIAETVSTKVSLLVTDNWTGYKRLGKNYPHEVIDHSVGQYVKNSNVIYLDAKKKEYIVGAIHTNTIEGFWSIFKRGIVGSFHKVSRKYMALYVAEFQFRYNNRMNADISERRLRDVESGVIFTPPRSLCNCWVCPVFYRASDGFPNL